jgi:hypothetical protein
MPSLDTFVLMATWLGHVVIGLIPAFSKEAFDGHYFQQFHDWMGIFDA